MKHFFTPTFSLPLVMFGFAFGALSVNGWAAETIVKKKIIIDEKVRFQTMDGFGTNITPAQWRDGQLRPVLDKLVDDVGCDLIRIDAYGDGNWLAPAKQQADGTFPEVYLTEVYNQKVFKDAWATAKYLNEKGVELIFNVSGDIPDAWKDPQTKMLNNFEAYAEMQVTLLRWAREKEGIKFRYHMPFNEMDLPGNVEGPSLKTSEQRVSIWKALIGRMKKNGFGDLKHILYCDAGFAVGHIEGVLKRPEYVDDIIGFSAHTYGNGLEGDANIGWMDRGTSMTPVREAIEASPYKGKKLWLTEYGDLDMTGEVEWEVTWRMNRRLMLLMEDGLHAALTWDAFDNYHVHDEAWARYGLFHTDPETFVYTPKKRYYGSKHFFKHIKKGYTRVKVQNPEWDDKEVYRDWHNPLRNLRVQAFLAPENKDLTLVVMNQVEGNTSFEAELPASLANRTFEVHHTNRQENYVKTATVTAKDRVLTFTVEEKSIASIHSVK